jgi:hypothetical protein
MILFATLIALGVVSFREESYWNRRRLANMLRCERGLRGDLEAQRHTHLDLRREITALETDHYYVERLTRETLGWRPALRPTTAPAPFGAPTSDGEPAEFVYNLPSLAPRLPAPVAPAGPPAGQGQVAQAPTQPPQGQPLPAPAPAGPAPGGAQPVPPALDPDQQLLASLGYGSVEEFQSKMMRGRPSGALDDATRARLHQLSGMLSRLGYASVKDFQARYGLGGDGIVGRRTEQRMVTALRQRQPDRRPGRGSTVVVEHGGSMQRRNP